MNSGLTLNHVALTVSDREKSAAFYGRYFGLTSRVHSDDHLLILSNETGALLALSEGEVQSQWPRTTHFGFQAQSVEDVLAARARFSDEGIEEAEWQVEGVTRVQVFDPDGYRVEIFSWS